MIKMRFPCPYCGSPSNWSWALAFASWNPHDADAYLHEPANCTECGFSDNLLAFTPRERPAHFEGLIAPLDLQPIQVKDFSTDLILRPLIVVAGSYAQGREWTRQQQFGVHEQRKVYVVTDYQHILGLNRADVVLVGTFAEQSMDLFHRLQIMAWQGKVSVNYGEMNA